LIAPAVLRHRLVLDYSARIDGETTDSVIEALLEEIPFQTTATPRTLSSATS